MVGGKPDRDNKYLVPAKKVMKKLSKLVALMLIAGSITACGNESTKPDKDTEQVVESEETTMEIQDENDTKEQETENENDTKEQETEITEDTETIEEQEQTESEEKVWAAGSYISEIYDVKEQGDKYEITAKVDLYEDLYVTPEEFEAYEVGKIYNLGRYEDRFCVEKTEEACYFTESEGLTLEESLQYGEVMTFRVDKTPDSEKYAVYFYCENANGTEWVHADKTETMQDTFVASNDCIIEYYSKTCELMQTTLEEFVNNQFQGSNPNRNLWRNLSYTELELNDKGEVVRITEGMQAG